MKYDVQLCEVLRRAQTAENTFDYTVLAPKLAEVAQPGQFAHIYVCLLYTSRRGAEPYRYAACSRGLSPREVLAVGENLRSAIASLREDADCVLLIAPESARFAEILPAAESCDAAVYVIEQDRASRTKIKAGIEKLLSCDVTVAGCVLNGVQAGLSGYGYGKYGYGYR